MRPDTPAKLDAQAHADLAAERLRHARAIRAETHGDSTAFTAECEQHLANVDRIMAAFGSRGGRP